MVRQRLFFAGLLLGLVWALWHALVDFHQNFHAMGTLWLLGFAVLYVAALTAYRLVMTWVHANTQSLLLAVLMHASYTGWLLVLYPATSLDQGLVWQTGFAAELWVSALMAFGPMAARLILARSDCRQATEGLLDPAGDIGADSRKLLQQWMDRYVVEVKKHAA